MKLTHGRELIAPDRKRVWVASSAPHKYLTKTRRLLTSHTASPVSTKQQEEKNFKLKQTTKYIFALLLLLWKNIQHTIISWLACNWNWKCGEFVEKLSFCSAQGNCWLLTWASEIGRRAWEGEEEIKTQNSSMRGKVSDAGSCWYADKLTHNIYNFFLQHKFYAYWALIRRRSDGIFM